jgi:hypothetical protein
MIGVRLGAAEGQLVEVRACLRAFSNGLPTRCSESYLDVANTKMRWPLRRSSWIFVFFVFQLGAPATTIDQPQVV